MSSPIFVVAKNTYIEMIRDRVLYFVLVFSVLFLALCFALGQLSYEEIFRLSVSLGLGGIHFCFLGLTIFLGCGVLRATLAVDPCKLALSVALSASSKPSLSFGV